MEKRTLRIAIVAGETSGDILGSGLINELKKQSDVDIEFVGIGGSQMAEQGFASDAEMEKLSIMGFEGLWENLREILSIRKTLLQNLIKRPPDVFIGIDVPDFNLTLEKKLRQQGIPTIHYVSPTVWAWRSYRIFKIRKAVSLMLTLFPFEKSYYEERGVPVTFVGHPLAKKLNPDDFVQSKDLCLQQIVKDAREKGNRLVAALPGSRRSEVDALGQLFIDSIVEIYQQFENVTFIVPLANQRVSQQFKALVEQSVHKDLLKESVYFVDGNESTNVMRESDVVLLASGTAALESSLLAKPTIVAYKVSGLTYWFARLTSRVKHVAMPNHLLEKPIVPEFLQGDATVDNLSSAVLRYLNDQALYRDTCQQLATIYPLLNRDSDKLAAQSVLKFIDKRVEKNG